MLGASANSFSISAFKAERHLKMPTAVLLEVTAAQQHRRVKNFDAKHVSLQNWRYYLDLFSDRVCLGAVYLGA